MSLKADHLLLIHGAWAGPWVWEPLVAELEKLGIAATALELPGNGFHDISLTEVRENDLHQAVDDALAKIEGKVVLIGHSGGGMLVTAAADRHLDKVIGGIWIAGMLLPKGEDFSDLQKQLATSEADFGVSPHVKATDDGAGTMVAPDIAATFFLNDIEVEEAVQLAQKFTPQPNVARRLMTYTKPHFNTLPKLYIQAKRDQSVVFKLQEYMCRNIENLDVVALDSGHCPHISQTKILVEILQDWLAK